MPAKKKVVEEVQAPEAPAFVDKAQSYADEAGAKGKIEVQHMGGDHPDDPTQHVTPLIEATNAGVFDYRA